MMKVKVMSSIVEENIKSEHISETKNKTNEILDGCKKEFSYL